MSDILLVLLGVFIVCAIASIIIAIEKIGKCRHDWGHWQDDSTNDAYVQYRVCVKCGYIEREQWRKLKEQT